MENALPCTSRGSLTPLRAARARALIFSAPGGHAFGGHHLGMTARMGKLIGVRGDAASSCCSTRPINSLDDAGAATGPWSPQTRQYPQEGHHWGWTCRVACNSCSGGQVAAVAGREDAVSARARSSTTASISSASPTVDQIEGEDRIAMRFRAHRPRARHRLIGKTALLEFKLVPRRMARTLYHASTAGSPPPRELGHGLGAGEDAAHRSGPQRLLARRAGRATAARHDRDRLADPADTTLAERGALRHDRSLAPY